jgi:gluconolactonase
MNWISVLVFVLALLMAAPDSALGQFISPIPDGAQLEFLTGGIEFGEGPLWHPDGFLLFTDVLADRVMKFDPETRVKQVHLNPSGGANGLGFDADLNLIMCRRDERDMARLEFDGSVTTLASGYDGIEFNGPNDLTVRSDGTIFFTDPNASGAPGRIDGVYSLTPGGAVHRLDSTLNYSNGITLSPNEERLFVNAANSKIIYLYDIESDSSLSNKRVFAHVSDARYLDGMKVDENGLLYVAGGGGVWIYSPEGALLDKLEISGTTTNLNFGDADHQRLYITEKNTVHRIELDTRGPATSASDANELPVADEPLTLRSYPNPFTLSTTVSYRLPQSGDVVLTIFNQLGQAIRILEPAYQPAGEHRVSWDGRDRYGNQVASGVYFYRLSSGSLVQTRTMLLIQ